MTDILMPSFYLCAAYNVERLSLLINVSIKFQPNFKQVNIAWGFTSIEICGDVPLFYLLHMITQVN